MWGLRRLGFVENAITMGLLPQWNGQNDASYYTAQTGARLPRSDGGVFGEYAPRSSPHPHVICVTWKDLRELARELRRRFSSEIQFRTNAYPNHRLRQIPSEVQSAV
jgi:hypothetical protein